MTGAGFSIPPARDESADAIATAVPPKPPLANGTESAAGSQSQWELIRRRFSQHRFAVGPKAPQGMPGGILSISANGNRDGILWATTPLDHDAFVQVVRGQFRAFDARTLELLWSSDRDDPDDVFAFAKYCAPTIANGKVYLATFSDRLNVYGILPPRDDPEWFTSLPSPPKYHGMGHGNMRQ